MTTYRMPMGLPERLAQVGGVNHRVVYPHDDLNVLAAACLKWRVQLESGDPAEEVERRTLAWLNGADGGVAWVKGWTTCLACVALEGRHGGS